MGPRHATLTSTIPVEPFSPPFHISLHFLAFECLPFIKKLLSLCQPQLHLRLPTRKVEAERDERKSLLLNLPDETADLLFMKEELPRPQRIGIVPVSMGIRADMDINEKDLSVFDRPVTIPEVDLTLPKGFYLCPK